MKAKSKPALTLTFPAFEYFLTLIFGRIIIIEPVLNLADGHDHFELDPRLFKQLARGSDFGALALVNPALGHLPAIRPATAHALAEPDLALLIKDSCAHCGAVIFGVSDVFEAFGHSISMPPKLGPALGLAPLIRPSSFSPR